MWKRSVPPTGVSPAIATISRGFSARYGLPIAITEVHTAGPREQQLFAGCVMRGKRRSRWPRRASQSKGLRFGRSSAPLTGTASWSSRGAITSPAPSTYATAASGRPRSRKPSGN